jgi:hypothetical protein
VAVPSFFSGAATAQLVARLGLSKLEIKMKKIYSRPTLVKRQPLAVVTAAAFSGDLV